MSLLNAHPTVEVNKKIRAEDFNILPIYTTLGLAYNAERTGDFDAAKRRQRHPSAALGYVDCKPLAKTLLCSACKVIYFVIGRS